MKRPGKKHTNILLPNSQKSSHLLKSSFTSAGERSLQQTWILALGRRSGADIRLHPGTTRFSPPVALSEKGFYLRALGVSAGLWLSLNFSLRNGEAKQTEQSAFRSKTEPQNRSLAAGSRHTVPALTSPKTNTLKTRLPQPGRRS